MFILNPYRFSASGSIDSDAQAFLTAAGITDPTIVSAIDDLVKGLKADALWSKMLALYPMVGGTESTHKWNLKDPRDLDAAFRLTWNGTWTHSATGADPDGSTAWANTHFVPSVRMYPSNGHLSYYSRQDAGSWNIPIGAWTVSNGAQLQINMSSGPTPGVNAGNVIVNSGNTFQASLSGVSSVAGLILGSRTANNSVVCYANGSAFSSNTSTATDLRPGIFVGIGARNTALGDVRDNFSSLECAGASLGVGLDSTEASNFYTRMQAFNTALSREV